MANIELDQIECLKDYQIFSKYFADTVLANCANYTISNNPFEIYSNIESSNHSQLLIQRLLIDVNPHSLEELFNFFCKNKYIEVKPCCDFNQNSKNEIFLYFIGHNDNRSLFGESASMMLNFVATLVISNIDPNEKTFSIALSFKPYSSSEVDFYEATHSHNAKVHTIARIAKKYQNYVFRLVCEINQFLDRHSFDRFENEDILRKVFIDYANKLDESGLPISFEKLTVRFLTHKQVVGLQQSKNLDEVVHWIKQDLGSLPFNYDLEFYSAKLDQCFRVLEMSEFIEKNELDDFLNADWWVVIHPIPTKDQVASFFKQTI
jgi:hypothetical protein